MAVIDSTFETKGTNVFFIDTIGNTDGVVRQLTCPTAITGLNGGTRDKIDTTCLDETGAFRTYIGGFADQSELTIPFILYKGDVGHQVLFALQASGAVVGWAVGFSDATSVPTMDSDQTTLTMPVDRSGVTFTGYVSNLTIDLATNEVVRGSLTVQPRSAPVLYWAP